MCRGKTSQETIVGADILLLQKILTLFPNSTKYLLPSHFYSQFKVLYEYMSANPLKRTEDEKVWIVAFKFNYSRSQTRDCTEFHMELRGHIILIGGVVIIIVRTTAVTTVAMEITVTDNAQIVSVASTHPAPIS